MSLVDVSVSMLTQLNVRSTTRRNASSRSSAATAASVSSTAIIVAMSGSIIPTPLAIPTTRAGPAPTVALGDLLDGVGGHDPAGRGREVVPAGDRRASPRPRRGCGPADSAARSRRSTRRARRRRSQPRRAATASTSASASASPSGPLATLAFFDTTTIARARPSARLRRLIVTLGPVKRLRVKTPAAGTGDGGGEHDEVVGVVLDADVGDVARRSRPGARSRAVGVAQRRLDGGEDARHRRHVLGRQRGR